MESPWVDDQVSQSPSAAGAAGLEDFSENDDWGNFAGCRLFESWFCRFQSSVNSVCSGEAVLYDPAARGTASPATFLETGSEARI